MPAPVRNQRPLPPARAAAPAAVSVLLVSHDRASIERATASLQERKRRLEANGRVERAFGADAASLLSARLDINVSGMSLLEVAAAVKELAPELTMIAVLKLDGTPAVATDAGVHSLRLERIVWEHLHRVLDICGGNKSETARRLGMTRAGFLRKLKRPPRSVDPSVSTAATAPAPLGSRSGLRSSR